MVTTGAALMLLAVFARITGNEQTAVTVHTFFEIFGANIAINFGLILIFKFESKYAIFENLLDISYTIFVLVIFGIIFDWYSSIPLWYLIVMAIVIYLFGFITKLVRCNADAKEMNELILKRKEKNANNAT